MTKDEASLIIGLDDHESIEDAIDFKLFEFKQNLRDKVPFEKTTESRIRQLQKLGDALEVLQFNNPGGEIITDESINKFEGLQPLLLSHQSFVSEWKLKLEKAIAINEIIKLLKRKIIEYRFYAEAWLSFLPADNRTDEVKASVEFDPVELLQAAAAGPEKYDEQELLRRESKRLALWLKLNGYE